MPLYIHSINTRSLEVGLRCILWMSSTKEALLSPIKSKILKGTLFRELRFLSVRNQTRFLKRKLWFEMPRLYGSKLIRFNPDWTDPTL